MTQVVLGSASGGRLSVLRNAGIEPVVIVSGVDEDAVLARHSGVPAAELVAVLASAKAEAVLSALPRGIAEDCVVIGCDSMLLLDGRLCGKPGTAERARAQWNAMAGHPGDLLTGHSVIRVRSGAVTHRENETACTTVHFGVPDSDDLDAYIAAGEPLWVAGAFTLDGRGGWFVDRIDGDPSNVIGLSLPLLRILLGRMGVPLTALWRGSAS